MKKNETMKIKDVQHLRGVEDVPHFRSVAHLRRIALAIVIFLIAGTAQSQLFNVFDVDTSNFPIMKAKFWALDENGEQIRNLSSSDFELTENGIQRNVTSVSCPVTTFERLSVVLLVDVTVYNDINNAKSVLYTWLDQLGLGENEVALVSYDGNSYINQDFTTDRNKLESAINDLRTLSSSEDHSGAMIRPVTGGISVAEKGKFKKAVLMLSSCSHFHENTIPTIINRANQSNVALNFVIFDRFDWTPDLTRQMSSETGGFSVNKIPYNDLESAKNALMKVYHVAHGGAPCEIKWESEITCYAGITNVELRITDLSITTTTNYKSPSDAVAKLEIEPSSIKILKPEVGVQKDTTITVTARNADFNVTNITSSNAAFFISPTSFSLSDGQSINLTLSYIPADSGYTFTKFDFENDVCPKIYYVSGGWPGKRPTIKTIKLLHPNGGEVFVAGSDTVITWEGVLPEEPVKLEYRTSDSEPWVTISDSATGLSWPFRVPLIESDTYLARVTAVAQASQYCDNPPVHLCNQIWMGCNLDVEFYRNGDPILHAQTAEEWKQAGEDGVGAWCYYDNDPENGAICGKLYNWYAVNDPRGLAPEGWRVASDDDWKELEMCLGMTQEEADEWNWRGTTEGARLAGGYDLWKDDFLRNHSNFNSSGFSGLPGGYRGYNGYFRNIRRYAYWWSSTEYKYSSTVAVGRYIYCYNAGVTRYHDSKSYGFSVRCVRE